MSDLWTKVDAVNALLFSWEGVFPKCISTEKRGSSGLEFTGYSVQFVVDAANKALGPENWRYEHGDVTVEKNPSGNSSTATVALTLYFRVGDEWITKGPTFGGSSNSNDVDARKGAVSDALKKAFALWSIGNRAMRGELDGKKSPAKNPPAAAKAQPADDANRKALIDEIKKLGGEVKTPAAEKRALQKKILGESVTLAAAPLAKLQELKAQLVALLYGAGPPTDLYTDLLTRIADARTAEDLTAIGNAINLAAMAKPPKLNADEMTGGKAAYEGKQAQLKGAA